MFLPTTDNSSYVLATYPLVARSYTSLRHPHTGSNGTTNLRRRLRADGFICNNDGWVYWWVLQELLV